MPDPLRPLSHRLKHPLEIVQLLGERIIAAASVGLRDSKPGDCFGGGVVEDEGGGEA